MNSFSFGGAWSKGVGLFSGRAAGQALILVGLGTLLPAILQYALIGGPAGLMNPAMLSGAMGGLSAASGALAVAALIGGYVLQIGSYFGSWRLGLANGPNVAGSVGYGLVAGLLVVIGLGLALALLSAVLAPVFGPAAALLLVILFLMLFAFLYTLIAAIVAVALFLLLILSMIVGVSMGQAGFAATLVGGSGGVAVVAVLLCVLLLWLAARFSCTTSVMAHRRSLNAFSAIGESWRLTADDQFRIMIYLGLIGLVMTVIAFIAAIGAGVVVAASFEGGGGPSDIGTGAMILTLIIGIPFAYLTVLVPGGIYREVASSNVSADLFD
jgi:hypothetical protein